jgi:hypothetical protein
MLTAFGESDTVKLGTGPDEALLPPPLPQALRQITKAKPSIAGLRGVTGIVNPKRMVDFRAS